MRGFAGGDELAGDLLDGGGGHCEADANVAAGGLVGVDLAGNTDDLTLIVEEWAAAVPVVNRRVGLYGVSYRMVVWRCDRAV